MKWRTDMENAPRDGRDVLVEHWTGTEAVIFWDDYTYRDGQLLRDFDDAPQPGQYEWHFWNPVTGNIEALGTGTKAFVRWAPIEPPEAEE